MTASFGSYCKEGQGVPSKVPTQSKLQSDLAAAVKAGNTNSMAGLISQGADPSDPELLRDAINSGDTDLVRLLIGKKSPVNAESLLFLAARNHQMPMVMLLKPYVPSQTWTTTEHSAASDERLPSANPEESCRSSFANDALGPAYSSMGLPPALVHSLSTSTFVVLKQQANSTMSFNAYGQVQDIQLSDAIYFVGQVSKTNKPQILLGKCILKMGMRGWVNDLTLCPPAPDAQCLP